MTARPHAHVAMKWPSDGGEPPNRTVALVTADLRAFWPPSAEKEDVLRHVAAAYEQLLTEIHEWYLG